MADMIEKGVKRILMLFVAFLLPCMVSGAGGFLISGHSVLDWQDPIELIFHGYYHGGNHDYESPTEYDVYVDGGNSSVMNIPETVHWKMKGDGTEVCTGHVVCFQMEAFANDASLSQVSIPKTILYDESEGQSRVFSRCTSLSSVLLYNDFVGLGWFQYCTSLRTIDLSNITRLDAYAFRGSGLGTVTLGDGHSSFILESHRFEDCASLSSVVLQEGLCGIGGYDFKNCTALNEVTIPSTVSYLGAGAFMGCTSLKSAIILGCSETTDHDGIFEGCTNLRTVTIGDGVTSLNSKMFKNCTNLEAVTIGKGVDGLPTFLFSFCANLKKIVFDGNAPSSVGVFAFEGVPSDCTVYVHRGSTGWGVDIPGTWHGCNIEYIEGASSSPTDSYTIVYEPGSCGSGSPLTATKTIDVSLALEDAIFTRDGYSQTGWATSDGGAKTYDLGAAYTANASATLYPSWAANKYTVSLDEQGGSDGTASVTASYGSAMPAVTVPRRPGYEFGGYYTGVGGGGTQYYTSSGASARSWDKTSETTLYAKWTEVSVSWSTYIVIDLSGGADALFYPVSHLVDVPVGGWTDEYKTTKLVLRMVEPGSFKMCGEYDVTLTKPFYMGVFEVTQRQYELVMGNRPSFFSHASYYATRPVEAVSYNMIRGSSSGAGWPESSDVDSDSFIGKLRARTQIDGFDLPTEAQWEYACHAGTTSKYNNGSNLDSDLKLLARYHDNGGTGVSASSTTLNGTAAVGSYRPNAWGLYDMHGNVWEWCLDWYGDLSIGLTNPVGSSFGVSRVERGGGWSSYSVGCVSSNRGSGDPMSVHYATGFRICCPLDVDSGLAVTSFTVTYNPDANSTGIRQTETKAQDVALTLKGAIFTRTGYTQTGWAMSDGGAKVYDLCELYDANASIDLYPFWKEDGVETPVYDPTLWPTPMPEPTSEPTSDFLPDPASTPEPVPSLDPTTDPNSAPWPSLEPGDVNELYEEVDGAAPAMASEYNGYLFDSNGNMKGTIQVKVGKPGKKDGKAAVKASIVLGANKVMLKPKDKGKAVISAYGPTEVVLVGGETCAVVLGAEGISGTYGVYFIDGARNFFAAKSGGEAANTVLGKWLGPVSVVWNGGSVNVSIAKKGKVKVKGTLADGKTKVSAKAAFLVGEEWCAVPVVAQKASLAFTLWLSCDGRTAVVEGLGDGAIAGKPGALAANAAFHISKTAGLWSAISGTVLTDYIPDGIKVASNGGKWVLPKAGKVAYKDGVVDELKLGENPSGLKLTYKAKDGSFKGSFKVYAVNGGKAKATTVTVTGVVAGTTGYGTATIKGKVSVAATVE